MTMMGKQKPTKQLLLDDKSFLSSTMKVVPIIEASKDTEMSYSPETMSSNEGGNINDCEEIKNHKCEKLKVPVKECEIRNVMSQVYDEGKQILMKETKDEAIRRMSKKEMTRVLSEWKNTYKSYKKEFSKLNLYQLRNEVRKLRDEMLSTKTVCDVETINQQRDSTKIAERSRELIEEKSSGKDSNKTPVKSKKKTKIISDHPNQELPIVTTKDRQVTLTPRTSDASLTRLKKEQLFELVKSWANYNGMVGKGLFKGMNKPSLVNEAKRVRKALAKAWTKRYNISTKSNAEGYICINKKTTDEEIRNLDIEKLIRIIQWWNVEWGEEVKNEDYNSFTKCELIEEVFKVRKELEVSGYPKFKKLSSKKQVLNGNVKSEIEKEQVIARKMTPLEKISSEWFEKSDKEVKERAQRWCNFRKSQGIPKLTALIEVKKSYELAKDVKISVTDRDTTSSWDRRKLFAVVYWKQPIEPSLFKMENEICEYDDDGMAELIDEFYVRANSNEKKKSNKRKKREATIIEAEATQKSDLLTNEELEQLTERENEKKAMTWYNESVGEVKLRINRYIEEEVNAKEKASIVEMASIAWKAYECQSDIRKGSRLEVLQEGDLKAYWYYFQKMDDEFKQWKFVRSEKNATVLAKVSEMLQKTRLKLAEDGVKTFLFNRAFTEEEAKILHWKYSSGPMIVAKVKKFEMEVENELGSNVEVEIHAIRTSYLWGVKALKDCNFKKLKRDEIDSKNEEDLRISTYWNQKQDCDHVKFGVIKHMDKVKLMKLATRVSDWVKRSIDYSVIDLEVITPIKTKELVDTMMTERDVGELSKDMADAKQDENNMEIDEKVEYNNEFDGKGIGDDELADLDMEMNELQKDFLPIVTPSKAIKKKINQYGISQETESFTPNAKQTTIIVISSTSCEIYS